MLVLSVHRLAATPPQKNFAGFWPDSSAQSTGPNQPPLIFLLTNRALLFIQKHRFWCPEDHCSWIQFLCIHQINQLHVSNFQFKKLNKAIELGGGTPMLMEEGTGTPRFSEKKIPQITHSTNIFAGEKFSNQAETQHSVNSFSF